MVKDEVVLFKQYDSDRQRGVGKAAKVTPCWAVTPGEQGGIRIVSATPIRDHTLLAPLWTSSQKLLLWRMHVVHFLSSPRPCR